MKEIWLNFIAAHPEFDGRPGALLEELLLRVNESSEPKADPQCAMLVSRWLHRNHSHPLTRMPLFLHLSVVTGIFSTLQREPMSQHSRSFLSVSWLQELPKFFKEDNRLIRAMFGREVHRGVEFLNGGNLQNAPSVIQYIKFSQILGEIFILKNITFDAISSAALRTEISNLFDQSVELKKLDLTADIIKSNFLL